MSGKAIRETLGSLKLISDPPEPVNPDETLGDRQLVSILLT